MTEQKPTLRKFTVYAVVFGNYEPAEVDSLYASEFDAVQIAERKNAISDNPAWEVRPMNVYYEIEP